MSVKKENITSFLKEIQPSAGDDWNSLIPLVYQELHRIAIHYMNKERKNHTLQPTALLNETFLVLSKAKNLKFENRKHFYGVSAQIMRRILLDHAKARRRVKRGGNPVQVSFDEKLHWKLENPNEMIALDSALTKLAEKDERKAKIIELRYFAGLSIEETADFLGLSPATVKREWSLARAWLYREISTAK